MKKFDELSEIYSAYKNYLAPNSSTKTKVEFDHILASVFCPGPFYYYVLDSPTLTFDYASPQVINLLGFDLANNSMGDLVDLVHPDDFDFFLKCEAYVANFIQNKITPDKIANYKISYCLRLKFKNGSYKVILHQAITLSTTPEGSLLKVFGIHSDISHITKTNSYKLSLTGINGEPSYIGIKMMDDPPSVSISNFSSRELQVIRFIMNGLTAKEIADRLFISVQTVNVHKKNAMAKAKCKNSIQLVIYCLQNGLI